MWDWLIYFGVPFLWLLSMVAPKTVIAGLLLTDIQIQEDVPVPVAAAILFGVFLHELHELNERDRIRGDRGEGRNIQD